LARNGSVERFLEPLPTVRPAVGQQSANKVQTCAVLEETGASGVPWLELAPLRYGPHLRRLSVGADCRSTMRHQGSC
jgi:hypothetical protein